MQTPRRWETRGWSKDLSFMFFPWLNAFGVSLRSSTPLGRQGTLATPGPPTPPHVQPVPQDGLWQLCAQRLHHGQRRPTWRGAAPLARGVTGRVEAGVVRRCVGMTGVRELASRHVWVAKNCLVTDVSLFGEFQVLSSTEFYRPELDDWQPGAISRLFFWSNQSSIGNPVPTRNSSGCSNMTCLRSFTMAKTGKHPFLSGWDWVSRVPLVDGSGHRARPLEWRAESAFGPISWGRSDGGSWTISLQVRAS